MKKDKKCEICGNKKYKKIKTQDGDVIMCISCYDSYSTFVKKHR